MTRPQESAEPAAPPSPPPARGTDRLRAAVIGSGKISEEHLRFLAASPLASLAGVCDLSPSLARYGATRFGAAKAYADAARMLDEARPDVVHVLTPPHTHVKVVTECLNAGAHVIVEKPIAPTHGEFRQLWELAQRKGVRLVEDHNYRFNEPILAIDRLVGDGTLGEVREVEVRMVLNILDPAGRTMDAALPHPSHFLPAGIVHDFLTHLCYLTLHRMPGEVDRVAAAWRKYGSDTIVKFDDLDALVLAGNVHGRIRFSSHEAPDCFTVTVRGSRGWAETDLFQPHLKLYVPRPGGKQLSPLVNQFVNGWKLAKASVTNFRNKVMQKTAYEGLATFLGRTYAALRDGGEPPVGFEDMDRASRLVDALLDEKNRV